MDMRTKEHIRALRTVLSACRDPEQLAKQRAGKLKGDEEWEPTHQYSHGGSSAA